MDNSFLLAADPTALANYLRTQATQLGNEAVTKDLLARVDSESLPPRVYVAWLSAGGGDVEAILQGLAFQNSQTVRQASITRFGKLFRTRRVKDIWGTVGGTAGVIDYLATASVLDVKRFCNEIRRSATAKVNTTDRVAFVDELYNALRDTAASRGNLETDGRPLSSIYNRIFSACSQELILSAVDGKSGIEDVQNGESAFFARTALFRSRCLLELQNPSVDVDMEKVRALLDTCSNDAASPRDANLTANNLFALEALELLSGRKELKGDAKVILSELATPLFRRLSRRKCLPETIVRATLAYVNFAQRHIPKRMSFQELFNCPGICLVKHWGRSPDLLEDSLVIFLRLAPKGNLTLPSEWLKLVKCVPSALRLRLLRMASRCDLNVDSELKQIQWDSPLLLALPRPEALQILRRLLAINAENLHENYKPERRQTERVLLMVRLSQHEPNLLELATAGVEEHKKKASQAREQTSRASYISLALEIAAASQCIELFRQTLLWTRKYIKDPLTAMEIFQGPVLTSNESLGLLRGFPDTRHDCALLTRDQVAFDVQKANTIITECFETACQAQREPGFKSYHWHIVLGMMSAAVGKRYESVNVLQDTLRLSDDEVFDTVWRDTLATCKSLEVLGLHDDNASLEFHTLGGPPMNSNSVLPVLVDPRPATLRFLDTLAKDRNDFWVQYRRKHVPATMTLDEPYPKGLPLECIVPVDLSQCKSAPDLPYLTSRAKAVVFVPADIAMTPQPSSDDDASAIGAFVESWQGALTKYVYLSQNRQDSALAAWEYAIGPLSATRMSDLEAHVFWSRIFSDSLEEAKVDGPWEEEPAQPPPPCLPAVEDDEQHTEWSPEGSTKHLEIKSSRRLEPARIDAMLNAFRSADKTIHSGPFIDSFSETRCHVLQYFWSRWRNPRTVMSPATREAVAAAAILHVSEANKLSPGILSTKFPSKEETRFPSLFLDGDFLEREDPKHTHLFAWGAMMRLSKDFPPTLLLRLARSLIEASTASKDRSPDHALKLLRVLIKGDRPQMALDMIQELVLGRPDDSSWQRLILNRGLLSALPKQIAEQFLQSLSGAMQRRLSAYKDKTSDQNSPRIKVTTVKLLSQLISGTMFIDDSFATSILIGLLASTSHIDIRVCVMESLVGILTKSQDKDLCDEIVAAFETHLVPVMSGINERIPLSEEEWMSYSSDNLPELYGLRWGDLPPILSYMISAVEQADKSIRQQLFDRILMPTFWKSCEVNGRWMQMFMKKHGVTLLPESLPSAPAHLQFLVDLMKWPEYIPASVLDLWLQILTVVLQPPSDISAMNKIVSEDADLRRSNDGSHWMALWGGSAQQILTYRSKPISMLLKEPSTTGPNGLTVDHIQRAVLQQFDLMLPFNGGISENISWISFVDNLKPLAWTSKNLGLWHQNIKPLLTEMLNKVEKLRTPEWRRDKNRSPATLPDTFEWRLWLLTPTLRSKESHDNDMNLLATSILELLSEMSRSNRAYMKKYETLVDFIKHYGTAHEWTKLALIFGNNLDEVVDYEDFSTLEDLRVDLTSKLLEAARDDPPGEEELLEKVRGMVGKMGDCLDEGIRAVGSKLRRQRGYNGLRWYAEIPVDG